MPLTETATGELAAPPFDLDPVATALFFDFDGTLAPIVADPRDARLPKETLALLSRLVPPVSGAVAVVSGRPVSGLDRMLAPLVLPLAGVHGRQRRDARGRLFVAAEGDAPELAAADARLAAFAQGHPGALVERKPGAVALHYRKRPELEDAARALARGIAQEVPGLRLIEGKMVAELCAGRHGKGEAVRDFMAEAPFAGRRPVYFGDDTTDEDAYPVVDAAGGLSVRIGPGATKARFRLADPAVLVQWMRWLADAWDARRGGRPAYASPWP